MSRYTFSGIFSQFAVDVHSGDSHDNVRFHGIVIVNSKFQNTFQSNKPEERERERKVIEIKLSSGTRTH